MNMLARLETAARAPVSKTPMKALTSNFIPLNANLYTVFRQTIVALFSGIEGVAPDIMALLNAGVANDLGRISADKLRGMLRIKPGDGKKPIVIEYGYSLTAIPATSVDKKRIVSGKSIPLVDAANAAITGATAGPAKNVETALTNLNEGKDVLTLPFYKGIVSATMNAQITNSSFGDEYVDALFNLSISISADIYSTIVDSDTFSPYLVQMGIFNILSAANNRADIIIDPRKTSTLTKSITGKYGKVKPRVNSDGFAVFQAGSPILIPKEADYTDGLIKTGDSAIDADGFFDENVLIDKGMANAIIYVDWLNDILAYTTATGKLEVLSLIGTSVLTPDVEFAYLQTPISDSDLVNYFKAINGSLNDVSLEEVQQYIDTAFRNTVPNMKAQEIYLRLISAGSKESPITLANLCGFDLEGIDDKNVINMIVLFKAYVKWLSVQKAKDAGVLNIPSNYASQGIRFRIIGLEYLIHAIANKDSRSVTLLRNEWATEQVKKRVEPGDQSFAIPNVKIGGSGLTGLLPHQGRIYSSMRKVPRLAVLPVATGGGKTILAFLDALSGIQANPGMRPIISTKGRLVKGMVSEINKVSQGAINAVPMRAGILRRMRMYGINTFEKLMKYVKDLPPNTVFINAYSDYKSTSKIYKELPDIPGIGNKTVVDSQYLRIMRIISFQMTIGDESHLIKNPTSKTAIGAYAAFCASDYRRIMSGTIVANTVKDLVGQVNALTPLVFGNSPDAFCDKHGISKGIIADDDTATLLKKKLMQFTAYHQATEDQWSFMLPNKKDVVESVPLTEKQLKFYDDLMLAAYLELTGKVKPGEEDPNKEDNEDEDEEEKEDKDEDDDEDDIEEGKFLALAQRVFQTVEQFLSAPDENEQYVAQADKPTGSDLISPKITRADQIIEKVLKEGEKDPQKNKIIVFGINLSAIRHFMRHSKYAKDAIVYYAGDEEAIRQYSTDPTKRILVAAETSIREGENLQMTRAIIKLQVPWAPGEYKQAIARMYRPDPRGTYNRDNVDHYVLAAVKSGNEPTLDGCKMARLISKFVSNARLTYENDTRWKRVSRNFDGLGLVRMNLEFIFNTKKNGLEDYFSAWDDFVGFENDLNTEERVLLARTLEASSGEKLLDANGKIMDVQKFIRLAMYDVTAAPVIPGSKSVYVPWVIGGLPPDPDNLGYNILGQQPVFEGDVVLTEFGPGIVRNISPRSVKVETYGGKLTGFRRSMVCTVPEVNKPKLKALVKDGKKWQALTKDPMGKVGSTALRTTTPLRDNNPAPATPNKPKVVKEKLPSVDVNTAIINGMPALVIVDMEESEALDKIGWQKIDPYTSVTFRNWTALTSFLSQLEEKAYVPAKVVNTLDAEIEEFKHGTITKITKQINANKVRSFFMDQHKRFGKKDGKFVVNPYLIAIDDEVRVAFDRDSHDQKVIQWLHSKVKSLSGVKAVRDTEGLYMKTFKDIAEARKHMSQLVNVISFDESDLSKELTLLRDEIQQLMASRKRPL